MMLGRPSDAGNLARRHGNPRFCVVAEMKTWGFGQRYLSPRARGCLIPLSHRSSWPRAPSIDTVTQPADPARRPAQNLELPTHYWAAGRACYLIHGEALGQAPCCKRLARALFTGDRHR